MSRFSKFSKFFGSAIGGITLKAILAIIKTKYPDIPIDEESVIIAGAMAGTYFAPANR